MVLPSAEGIVALTIGVPRHGRAPCLPRDPAAPSQECETTGKKDATLWRLTSPGAPALLRGVGCARGGSTLIEGGLGHVERLQTLPVTSPLGGYHIGERKLSRTALRRRFEERSCIPLTRVLSTVHL
jgi:hypothetical protein